MPKENVKFIDEQPGALQRAISGIRKDVWPAVEAAQVCTCKHSKQQKTVCFYLMHKGKEGFTFLWPLDILRYLCSKS